jgi:putative addiction module component (TIGR02574 family)
MSVLDFSHLSPQQRVELIGELCDSLNEEVLPMSDALKTELDRRIGGFAEQRVLAEPWSEVRAKLRPQSR